MVSLKDVEFSYERTKVFQGLNIEFAAGKIYGIMGKNGTGKSTLLAAIAGLIRPDRGSIKILDETPSRRQPEFLSNIFLVPEEFHLPNIPIDDYVNRQGCFYPKFDPRQFNEYLRQFDIGGNESLQQMSYGQKKKVLISFGLACNTTLLLMDEPTNGLDVVSKAQFKKIMAGAFDENRCFIISTHQVRDIENLVDHICFIDDGQILLNESTKSLSENLVFKISFDKSENALFREELLQGEATISKNLSGKESKIDMEMLYKAISENPQAICSVFYK